MIYNVENYYSEGIMSYYEINGNLQNEKDLIYEVFSHVVWEVMDFFIKAFGEHTMSLIGLYIDNSTAGGGYTPVTTPVLKKYVIIRLHIHKESCRSMIAFQLGHELMHYLFYVKYGLDKPAANDLEESICTAVSLIVLKNLYPDELDEYIEYVNSLSYDGYRYGGEIARRVDYDMQQIKSMV